MADANPYEGLSDEARELCVKRMIRTLAKKPRRRATRRYVNSLTGQSETAESLWARARKAAEKVIAFPSSTAMVPVIAKRKDRLSPMAQARWSMAHPTKACRNQVRFQPEVRATDHKMPRDLSEVQRQREMLFAAQGGLCAICSGELPYRLRQCSIDHVIPRAMGGQDAIGNLVLTHGECNGDKTNDIPTGCEMIWLLMVNAKLGALPVVF